MAPKKRSKLFNARRIVVQNTDDALKDGRINIPAFIGARQREIEKLAAAMQTSKTAGSQRAFQSLPRSLRRRAASHDVKRIPKRLRARALQEVSNDDPSCHKRLLTGKNKLGKLRGHKRLLAILEQRKHIVGAREKNAASLPNLQARDVEAKDHEATPPAGKLRFEHRQKNKTWLPSHVWHAKRAHFETQWGFQIPEKPSQKCYRKTHRGIKQEGATVWDVSYFATFRVETDDDEIRSLLATWLGPKVLRKRFFSGEYCFSGDFRLNGVSLGPVQVYWESATSVVLRAHPSLTATLLQLFNSTREEKAAHKFHYTDLRYAVGSIDIGGPKALQVLNTVLTPTDESSKSAKMFRTLSHLATIDSLPENAVFHLLVTDPRYNHPPKAPRQRTSTPESIMDTLVAWPGPLVTENLQNKSVIFSKEARLNSYVNQLSLKGISRQRSNKLQGVGGQPPPVEVPVTVIRSKNQFSVLLPWFWVLPFWFAINHIPCVSMAGTRQRHQVAYETGQPFFPNDFPQTEAGQAAELFRAQKLESKHSRTPSAKRVSYLSEVGDPFACDWSLIKPESVSDVEFATSLSTVTLKYQHRGTPQDRARIYAIPEESKQVWLDAVKMDPENSLDYPLVPDKSQIIGFVTTGDFNLQQGCGFAIASVVNVPEDGLVVVRNCGQGVGRLAKIERV